MFSHVVRTLRTAFLWVGSSLTLWMALAVSAQTASTYLTSSDLAHRLEPQAPLEFAVTVSTPPAISIRVSDEVRYQTMDGFGAAMTDGSAWILEERLPPAMRRAVLTQLFDRDKGIGLSFLRQPIGSTDLSRSHSSFDDVPPGQRDPALHQFSVAHDEKDVFPAVRAALKLNPAIVVMATPWSPPAWMKSGETMDGGRLREEAMESYAEYLTRSVQSFEAAGVPVTYVSVQNEPLNETHDYPGTLMPSMQAARLIGEYLGPDLRKAGLNKAILAYDHNWDHPEYPIGVLSDPRAAPFVAGSAMHCYGGDVKAQNQIHDRYPNKGIWMTECSGGSWDKETPLAKTAHILIESTRNWAKAVVLWGLILDSDHGPHDGGCGTCRPLVEVDLKRASPVVSYTGDFYGIGHASKFVHPGATRIDSDSFGVQGLETVAFQNIDGSVALLVMNNELIKENFRVIWHGRQITAEVGAGELATFVW